MIYSAPAYLPQLPYSPPDSVPVHDFLFNTDTKKYGRRPIEESKDPFVCGLSGKSYTTLEVAERFELLSRSLAAHLGWRVNKGNEFDKVTAIYSPNTIDTMTIAWATHRANGVCSLISASYTVEELTLQLKRIKCKALFTSLPLLQTALKSAAEAGIGMERVYLIDLPFQPVSGVPGVPPLRTVDQLIDEGGRLDALEPLQWSEGQGARQTAFLCSSSGTSGLPKNVKVSHKNVITSILQLAVCKATFMPEPEMVPGVLPMTSNFGLFCIAHLAVYRGDGVAVLPTFDLVKVLETIQKFSLGTVFAVPAMLVAMLRATALLKNYNLSSINTFFIGAGVLSQDTVAQIRSIIPGCNIVQAYGLTETTGPVTCQMPQEHVFGSCGHIFPGVEARVVDETGQDVKEVGMSGELLLRSPSIMLGYLDEDEITPSPDTFTPDGWLRTGDLVEFRRCDKGYENLFVIDRCKELIKVRGMQVSPLELEDYLNRHPSVADAAVVPVPDEHAEELPLAFIVKSPAATDKDDATLKKELTSLISDHLAAHKRLAGGIQFVESLPKTSIGKIKRGVLKGMAKELYEASKREKFAVVGVYEFNSDDDELSDKDA